MTKQELLKLTEILQEIANEVFDENTEEQEKEEDCSNCKKVHENISKALKAGTVYVTADNPNDSTMSVTFTVDVKLVEGEPAFSIQYLNGLPENMFKTKYIEAGKGIVETSIMLGEFTQ
jgi:hypothetical protein